MDKLNTPIKEGSYILILPIDIMRVLRPFTQVLSEQIWAWATVLLKGTILASVSPTVTIALCMMKLSTETAFQNDRRVLYRAHW